MKKAPSKASDVGQIIARARAAQAGFEAGGSQERYNRAALAAGWAVMEPERNKILATLAVETTGLGKVSDKIIKNHRKTLGLLRDISDAQTYGVVSDDPVLGITKIVRPLGLIGAIVPSTNPVATPANNIINALKGGNAIILSPSPKGRTCCSALLDYIHREFKKIGETCDLVQMLPGPANKEDTQALLENVDLAIVTGSQDNVRRAYSSGTPAIGVGAGNVATIIDETADLNAAAAKIAASKCFDNATSCSSENAIIVVDAIYDDFIAALCRQGGGLVPLSQEKQVTERLWTEGKLNRHVMARDAHIVIEALGLSDQLPAETRFLVVETRGIGANAPLSGEKLSLVAALYRAIDFDDARAIAGDILNHQGAGHSVGIHSALNDRALSLGHHLPTCRVIVNQAHSFATGGSFDNGMPFSLSMGCGSWGGNSIDENLHWRHFVQHTKIVYPIPSREPSVEDIFAQYWSEAGR